MDLSGLLQGIERAPSFARLREAVTAERAQTGGRLPGLVIGVGDAAKAAAIAVLAGAADGPLIVGGPRGGRAVGGGRSPWRGEAAPLVPSPQRDSLPYERLAPDPEAVRARLTAVSRLAAGGRRGAVAAARGLG